MHILFICNTYPGRDNPRRGIFYRDQAMAMKAAGHRVGVLVVNGIPPADFIFGRSANPLFSIDNGLPVYRSVRLPFPIWHRDSPLYLFSMVAPVRLMYARYTRKEGHPDIIHAQSFFYAGLITQLLKTNHPCPIILTEHDSNFMGNLLSEKRKALVKKHLGEFGQVIAVSHALAEKLDGYPLAKKTCVVGNLVDTEFFNIEKHVKNAWPFTFAILANLDKNKSVDIAVKAFYKAFNKKDNVHLIIIGNGPEKSTIEEMISRYGLEKQIILQDFLNRDELLELYKKAHVVFSTSEFETFGLTLAEALSCGIPVISTRSGGPQDFINGDVGLLVDVGDIVSLSEAMLSIFQNYSRYSPSKIRSYLIKNYSRERIINQLVAIYNEELSQI